MVYVKELLLFLAACSIFIFICVWYHSRAFKKHILLPRWQGQPKSPVIIPVTQNVLAEGDGQFGVVRILGAFYVSIIGLENIARELIKDGPRSPSPTRTQQASLTLQREFAFTKLNFLICRDRVLVEFGRSKSTGIGGMYEVLEKCGAELKSAEEKLSHNDDCFAEIENMKQELEGLEIHGMNIKRKLEGLGNDWGLENTDSEEEIVNNEVTADVFGLRLASRPYFWEVESCSTRGCWTWVTKCEQA